MSQHPDPFDERLPCATCGGTGEVDALPYTRAPGTGPQMTCRDCMGSGKCPAEHPVRELDDEYEVDDRGQFRRIPEDS